MSGSGIRLLCQRAFPSSRPALGCGSRSAHCQLGRADSLREICNGLGCCLGRLIHVGIARAPCRSTLSYANEHRPAALFEDLFFAALARFRDQQGLGTRKHKFRFKNKLLSLDSTTISLCLTMFPWAKFRRAKGGVKAHVLLDHDDYLPAYVLLTEAKRSDVKLADFFRLNPGSIVAIDRGYIDYALFGRWSMAGVFFVTRLKDNAAFEVVEECEIPRNRNIRADQLIRLTGAQAQADYPDLLRRIVAWDAENEREIVLLTNLLEFGATTIAAIYKERWQIELFQSPQAEFDREDLRRHQRERTSHPDLDSLDRPAPVEMAAPPLQGQLVSVHSGLHAAAKLVHLPRFDRVARQS